jgi:hypothetical protein
LIIVSAIFVIKKVCYKMRLPGALPTRLEAASTMKNFPVAETMTMANFHLGDVRHYRRQK